MSGCDGTDGSEFSLRHSKKIEFDVLGIWIEEQAITFELSAATAMIPVYVPQRASLEWSTLGRCQQ